MLDETCKRRGNAVRSWSWSWSWQLAGERPGSLTAEANTGLGSHSMEVPFSTVSELSVLQRAREGDRDREGLGRTRAACIWQPA